MDTRTLDQPTELEQSRESSELTRPSAEAVEEAPSPAADGKQSAASRAGEISHGAIRGTVAAMAMSGLHTLTVELGLVDQPPPEAIMKQKAKPLVEPMPRGPRTAAIELAHWSYGALGGVAFSMLPNTAA